MTVGAAGAREAPGEALSAAEARRKEVKQLERKKTSLMRELDMLDLMCKLMQGAIELPGKGTGGELAGGLTNRVKTIVGDALREEGYLLASLLSAVDMKKSSYFY
jgi:putative transposase